MGDASLTLLDLPADVWVKVASEVTTGVIQKISSLPNVYWQTYRFLGEPGPVDDSDKVVLFGDSNTENISSDVFIDVYVKAVGRNGEVRINI